LRGSERNDWQGSSRQVNVAAFCLDRSEVTVEAYSKCVQAKKCAVPDDGQGANFPLAYNWGKSKRERHPINGVGWQDAFDYCHFVGKRLPTNEEWERAAKGRNNRLFPWGNSKNKHARLNACGKECQAWAGVLEMNGHTMYDEDDGWPTTSPICAFPSGNTPEGVCDLAGNVWEWTSFAHESLSTAPTDASVTPSERRHRQRGGAWNSNDPRMVQSTASLEFNDDDRSPLTGFRCASVVEK
jgi:formylglycine-generating enzyme required for sulfatase activity